MLIMEILTWYNNYNSSTLTVTLGDLYSTTCYYTLNAVHGN